MARFYSTPTVRTWCLNLGGATWRPAKILGPWPHETALGIRACSEVDEGCETRLVESMSSMSLDDVCSCLDNLARRPSPVVLASGYVTWPINSSWSYTCSSSVRDDSSTYDTSCTQHSIRSLQRPKFHGSSFLVTSSCRPRDILVDTPDIVARMLRGCRACRACRATVLFSLPRAYLIGRPAVCCPTRTTCCDREVASILVVSDTSDTPDFLVTC